MIYIVQIAYREYKFDISNDAIEFACLAIAGGETEVTITVKQLGIGEEAKHEEK